MARRRLLTREALARQLDPPTDEREIARHFTLTREDLDSVSIRRGPASQLAAPVGRPMIVTRFSP